MVYTCKRQERGTAYLAFFFFASLFLFIIVRVAVCFRAISIVMRRVMSSVLFFQNLDTQERSSKIRTRTNEAAYLGLHIDTNTITRARCMKRNHDVGL